MLIAIAIGAVKYQGISVEIQNLENCLKIWKIVEDFKIVENFNLQID